MKKGCFITTIVVSTILLGTALYLVQNHFDSIFGGTGRKIIASFVKNNLNKQLEKVIESPEKKELIETINNLADNSESLKKFKEKDVNQIIDMIESAITDSVIERSELDEISQKIKANLK